MFFYFQLSHGVGTIKLVLVKGVGFKQWEDSHPIYSPGKNKTVTATESFLHFNLPMCDLIRYCGTVAVHLTSPPSRVETARNGGKWIFL